MTTPIPSSPSVTPEASANPYESDASPVSPAGTIDPHDFIVPGTKFQQILGTGIMLLGSLIALLVLARILHQLFALAI